MPITRPKLVTGEYYHIYNRGVEKRDIFLNTADFFRFIFCLYELNDKNMVVMRDRMEERKIRKKTSIGETHGCYNRRRELLVEIIAFCLMPNHYHLVLRQLVDGGISLFMKKLSNSYTGYFNEKYERKGAGSLFQGCFKGVHVGNDKQLMSLVAYIFTNPVELVEKNWKEGGARDPRKTVEFLKNYRWSSYLDYIGITNFSSVTKRDFITEFFGSPEKIKEFVESWILYKTELKKGFYDMRDLTMD
ncbi:MAG: transposase [Candidatus Nealsonbacteria bacterium]|nr:transposase [Candidatus Nealsonbacteria bacterium]